VDQAALLRQINSEMNESTGSIVMRKKRIGGEIDRIRVIAVTSGKGGVGKTHISANIAYNLSKLGKRTLVLDADMGLANIDIILGLTPRFNLHHVLQGEKTLEEVIVEGPGEISILPAASGIQEMTELSQGQKLSLMEAINTLEESFDFMIVDTAAGIAGNVLYFSMAAKEIIVVVSPEPTSMTDAYAMIKLLYQKHAEKRILLLVNMVKNYQEAKEVYLKVSRATQHFLDLSIEYLGHIVYDEKVTESVRHQRALAEIYPRSKANQCIKNIARKMVEEPGGKYNIGSFKFFSKSIIGEDCG